MRIDPLTVTTLREIDAFTVSGGLLASLKRVDGRRVRKLRGLGYVAINVTNDGNRFIVTPAGKEFLSAV